MMGSVLVALLVLAFGERASDALERRQHEVVLKKLPVADAHAYYERLRRRDRRVRWLRAVTVTSLLVLGYAYRRHLVNGPRHVAPASGGSIPGSVDGAHLD